MIKQLIPLIMFINMSLMASTVVLYKDTGLGNLSNSIQYAKNLNNAIANNSGIEEAKNITLNLNNGGGSGDNGNTTPEDTTPKDTTAPIITINEITIDGLLTGNSDEPNKIFIIKNENEFGNQILSGTTNNDGSFSITIPTNDLKLLNNIIVEITDESGNIGYSNIINIPKNIAKNCYGLPIGSEVLIDNVSYLVVSNTTIKSNLNRASTLCTSHVTDMKQMFNNATSFNQDISHWDTSNVINMSSMFNGATAFNQDISHWDTSNVINMSGMFYNAKAFNQDISNWDTSKVTNMLGMFDNAKAFNQDISLWDTSKVSDMTWMFNSATAFNQDISGWNVSLIANKPTNFDYSSGFVNQVFKQPNWGTNGTPITLTRNDNGTINCSNGLAGQIGILDGEKYFIVDNSTTYQYKNIRNNLNIADKLCTSHVTDMKQMFNNATSFNQDISLWDTSKVANMSGMFYNAKAFNQDISNWDTSKVSDMGGMFYGATSFNQDISNWDTSNVVSMSWMFYLASSFNQDISLWDTSKVSGMSYMFAGARSFNQDISHWDTSKVSGMSSMFSGATAFNQNLSGWCVSLIANYPIGFDAGTTAWVKTNRQPVWGTCPL